MRKETATFLLCLPLLGCEVNPLEEMITEDRIQTTYQVFGRTFLERCDKQGDKYDAGRCKNDIEKTVSWANTSGHEAIRIEHFTDEMVAHYIATVKPLYVKHKIFKSSSGNMFDKDGDGEVDTDSIKDFWENQKK